MTGTALFQRILANAFDDAPDRHELMVEVWSPTPWIVEAYTGRTSLEEQDRDFGIRQWCRDKFGPEASPIHDITGRWQRGSVTIHGWTWLGFDTEAAMNEFMAAWPKPENVPS